jgi:hypothetical protein
MKKNMKIKESIVLIILCVLIILVITSCKKNEDETGINLTSRKAKVANTWEEESYKINGFDFTSLVADYTEAETLDFQTYDKDIMIGSDDQ